MGKITINELEIDVIRAWKDEEYRNSLSEEQRSQLPENPAGIVEIPGEDLESINGGVVGSNGSAFYYYSSYQWWRCVPREFREPYTTYFLTGCSVFPRG